MRVACWSVVDGGVGRFGFWIVWRHDGFLLSVAMSRFEACVEGLAISARLDSRMLKKRDSNIVAYRCFLIFGIVALYCAYVTLGSFTRENNM